MVCLFHRRPGGRLVQVGLLRSIQGSPVFALGVFTVSQRARGGLKRLTTASDLCERYLCLSCC